MGRASGLHFTNIGIMPRPEGTHGARADPMTALSTCDAMFVRCEISARAGKPSRRHNRRLRNLSPRISIVSETGNNSRGGQNGSPLKQRWWTKTPFNVRRLIVIDAIAVAASFILSLAVRFDAPSAQFDVYLSAYSWIIP